MGLELQHEAVVVRSLCGTVVQELRGVCAGCVFEVGYLRADGRWYRFFLDEGVLFLSEGSGPEAEEDFGGVEEGAYVDVLAALGGPSRLTRLRMQARTLELSLATGRSLVVRDDGNEVRYSVEHGSRPA